MHQIGWSTETAGTAFNWKRTDNESRAVSLKILEQKGCFILCWFVSLPQEPMELVAIIEEFTRWKTRLTEVDLKHAGNKEAVAISVRSKKRYKQYSRVSGSMGYSSVRSFTPINTGI